MPSAKFETLLEKYEARIPNASGFALENRVLLLKNCEGTGIDKDSERGRFDTY